MKSNALYFPQITVPDDAWTIKALLYWDKLSSIVPLDQLIPLDQLTPRMQKLEDAGLVEPLIPSHFVHQIKEFDERFIELIEHRLKNQPPSIRFDGNATSMTPIHAEKLGDIPGYLVDVGLARQGRWPWYEVETRTANLFMSYLAVCLAALPDVDATPVTDSTLIASTMLPPSDRKGRREVHAHKAREVVLRELLPVPKGPVDIDRLVRFKRQHGHLLPDLRRKVEAHCTYVASLAGPSDRIEANEAFIRDIRQQVAEIEAAMRPSLGPVVLGSLLPLLGAGLSWSATDPGAPAAYAGAATSFASAAYMAIASVRGPRKAVSSRPLAYLAHARRALHSPPAR